MQGCRHTVSLGVAKTGLSRQGAAERYFHYAYVHDLQCSGNGVHGGGTHFYDMRIGGGVFQ